jgi:hypothetical protein
MLNYLRNKFAIIGLQAHYERLIHERLLKLTEDDRPQSVEEDPGRWQLAGGDRSPLVDEPARRDARSRARQLVAANPHARNILRLLEAYVAGPGLKLTHQLRVRSDESLRDDSDLLSVADRLWDEFLAVNQTHYSYREHARRAWRDGECFIRQFPTGEWPPAVRFVDPERIGATPDDPDSNGIVTLPPI